MSDTFVVNGPNGKLNHSLDIPMNHNGGSHFKIERNSERKINEVQRLLQSDESSDDDTHTTTSHTSISRNSLYTPKVTTEQILRRRQVMFDSDEDDLNPPRSSSNRRPTGPTTTTAKEPVAPSSLPRKHRLARLWSAGSEKDTRLPEDPTSSAARAESPSSAAPRSPGPISTPTAAPTSCWRSNGPRAPTMRSGPC